MANPTAKRRYNVTYRLRLQGFVVDTKRKEISIRFNQISLLIGHPGIIALVKEYNYTLIENRQLRLDL